MHSPLRPSLSRGSSKTASSTTTNATSQSLLFGEISSLNDGKSSCAGSSVCNLVLSTDRLFLDFWLNESCRNAFLRNADSETLAALRQVCHSFASSATPYLFGEISVKFTVSSFTKPGKMNTLNRIGRYVKKLNFRTPHSHEAFLPPLVNPMNGDQITFSYTPQLSAHFPKYGSVETDDLLIQQYPPVFHAATNIPSFIRAFSAMPNLERVSIYSTDQAMSERYRKSSADYALSSLRIAMEQAHLPHLHSMSIHNVHPQALRNLLPVLSPGSSPSSCRRWLQIRSLAMEMDPLFTHPSSRTLRPNHDLRSIQVFLRAFTSCLSSLSFKWTGNKPSSSPLFLPEEPVVWTPALGQYKHNPGQQEMFNNSFPPPTPPPKDHEFFPQRSATTTAKHSKPLRFVNLQYLDLHNCVLKADQLAAFITRHRSTLMEFCFEGVSLRGGDWASTLEPIRMLKRIERAQRAAAMKHVKHVPEQKKQVSAAVPKNESNSRTYSYNDDGILEMDVPCFYSVPTGEAMPLPHPPSISPPWMPLDSSPLIEKKVEEKDDNDLVIMETLEPQPEPVTSWGAGIKRRWFGSNGTNDHSNEGSLGKRHERKLSDHLRRVLNGSIFSWR